MNVVAYRKSKVKAYVAVASEIASSFHARGGAVSVVTEVTLDSNSKF
jgi:hypothetical protein